MPQEEIHRFEVDGKRFAVDTETCFCFACDEVSWDVLEFYPETPVNRIYHELSAKHPLKELQEVVGELEWLRATKSILATPRAEDQKKRFELERGVKEMTVVVQDAARTSPDLLQDAADLLLSRAGQQTNLTLGLVCEGSLPPSEILAAWSRHAFKKARLAGKNVTVFVQPARLDVPKRPKALDGHALSLKLAFQDAGSIGMISETLAKTINQPLARVAKTLGRLSETVSARIVVQPNHPDFGSAVEALDKAGFRVIELDLDGALVANPTLTPAAMRDGLKKSADYYAKRLLEHHYFRLDPVAPLFRRIYNGTPLRRADPAGTNALAMDAAGGIYPSAAMVGFEDMRLGAVAEGTIDEDKLKAFEDVGSITTPVCLRCWARNLCGGGPAAVHRALTGSFRKPHAPWCDAQRVWMTSVVSAFNVLSSAGVNFTRVYGALGRSSKPSLLALARAAFRMTIGVRPTEEADADMLKTWEDWNEAAYFTTDETGLLLATKYDREMDALHPRGLDRELVLVKKSGQAFGLVRIRPDRVAGAACAWVYMRNEADYASDAVRKGFRSILKEAVAQEGFMRLTVQTAAHETSLHAFLEAVGFSRAGVLREALFLHGRYHDTPVYAIAAENL